ncbi:MAG: hypothetical protein ABWY82_12460, partial [Tardiphaga sp.]
GDTAGFDTRSALAALFTVLTAIGLSVFGVRRSLPNANWMAPSAKAAAAPPRTPLEILKT